MSDILAKACSVCGKERKPKALLYDSGFSAFCANPYICSQEHPNSPKNILERNSLEPMYTFEQALDRYRHSLAEQFMDKGLAKRVHRLISSPTTIRIQEPEIAKFLVKFQQEHALPSISDAIRRCIELVKEGQNVTVPKPVMVVAETLPVQEDDFELVEDDGTTPDDMIF